MLERFGNVDSSEKDCVDSFKNKIQRMSSGTEEYYWAIECAPLVVINLELIQNGSTKRSVNISRSLLPYGPGTGRMVTTNQQITDAIKKMFH